MDGFEAGLFMVGKHPSQLNAATADERNRMMWQELQQQTARDLERRQELAKQETDAGKSAEYFFKANPTALNTLGLDDTSFKNLSARDKFSAMIGYGKGQLAAAAAKKQAFDAQAAAAFREAMATRTASPLGGTRPDVNWQQAMTESAAEAMGRTGNTGAFDDLIKARVFSRPEHDATPQLTQVGGRNVIFSPSTGKWEFAEPNQPKGLTFDQRVSLMDREALHRERAVYAKTATIQGDMGDKARAAMETIDARIAQLNGGSGQPAGPAQPVVVPVPAAGAVRNGYRFKGGNPNDRNNWVPVK